jgi:hypothetical protein
MVAACSSVANILNAQLIAMALGPYLRLSGGIVEQVQRIWACRYLQMLSL